MAKSRNAAVRTALVTAGVALLVLAGGLTAGVIGIKITAPISGPNPLGPQGGPLSESGTNYIGLPYAPKASLVTARDLFADIGGTIQQLSQHRKIDDTFEIYTYGGGSLPPNGWDLVPGEGYVLKLGMGAPDYVVVGTHMPNVVIEFKGADGGVTSESGLNYFAPPYHGVSRTARELFTEIGGSVQQLSQHRKIDDTFEVYTFGGGSLPPNGWDIMPGESYIVKVGDTQRFRPLHF
jgi:hypothetical protein